MVVIGLLSDFFGIIVLLLCGCYGVVMIIFSFFLCVRFFVFDCCDVSEGFLCCCIVVFVWF